MFNKEYGSGGIYVYKRPHLREFLLKVAQLGQVSIFTHHQRSYADPIIDKLDPERKIFKHRFYSEHCINNGDGEILKDMRKLEPFVDPSAIGQTGANAAQDQFQNGGGGNPFSFSQRLNQAIGIPVFGAGAFAGNQAANVRNQGDIQLSRQLLERLVIVDDGILTYNAYKSKSAF